MAEVEFQNLKSGETILLNGEDAMLVESSVLHTRQLVLMSGPKVGTTVEKLPSPATKVQKIVKESYQWEETIWYELMTGDFYLDAGGTLHRKALLVIGDKSVAFAVVCDADAPLGSVAYLPEPSSKVYRRTRRSVAPAILPQKPYTEDGSAVFGC